MSPRVVVLQVDNIDEGLDGTEITLMGLGLETRPLEENGNLTCKIGEDFGVLLMESPPPLPINRQGPHRLPPCQDGNREDGGDLPTAYKIMEGIPPLPDKVIGKKGALCLHHLTRDRLTYPQVPTYPDLEGAQAIGRLELQDPLL